MLLLTNPTLKWRSDEMSRTQPVPPPGRSMHGIGHSDLRMTTDSFLCSSQTSRPSIDSSAGERARSDIWGGVSCWGRAWLSPTHLQPDLPLAGQDDCAERQRARRDGREEQCVGLGVGDWPAGRERVGRRACRGGEEQAVRLGHVSWLDQTQSSYVPLPRSSAGHRRTRQRW